MACLLAAAKGRNAFLILAACSATNQPPQPQPTLPAPQPAEAVRGNLLSLLPQRDVWAKLPVLMSTLGEAVRSDVGRAAIVYRALREVTVPFKVPGLLLWRAACNECCGARVRSNCVEPSSGMPNNIQHPHSHPPVTLGHPLAAPHPRGQPGGAGPVPQQEHCGRHQQHAGEECRRLSSFTWVHSGLQTCVTTVRPAWPCLDS